MEMEERKKLKVKNFFFSVAFQFKEIRLKLDETNSSFPGIYNTITLGSLKSLVTFRTNVAWNACNKSP